MAQIVLIDEGTYREGVNNIGDVVSVHDDNVFLGPSYSGFRIVSLPGTVEEVLARLNASLPEIKRVYRSKAGAGEWAEERPEEAEVWNDNGTWRKIEKNPKYRLNLPVTEELDSLVKDEALPKETKLALVGSTVVANITRHVENTTAIKISKPSEEVRA